PSFARTRQRRTVRASSRPLWARVEPAIEPDSPLPTRPRGWTPPAHRTIPAADTAVARQTGLPGNGRRANAAAHSRALVRRPRARTRPASWPGNPARDLLLHSAQA